MARKPSFNFERQERDKAKVAKRAEKTKTKSGKKVGPGEVAGDAEHASEAND